MSTMKKVAGVALAVTATAGAAAAASVTHEAAGRIEHLNPRRQHLTVGNQVFRYDPRIVGVGLRRGAHVRILYRETHGHRYAVKIMTTA